MNNHCERSDESEITPEMIEAGYQAFEAWFDEHEDVDSSRPPRPWVLDLARRLYREMSQHAQS